MTGAAVARQRRRRRLVSAGFALALVFPVAFIALSIPRAATANRLIQCSNNLKILGVMLPKGLDPYEVGLLRRGDSRALFCPEDSSSTRDGAPGVETTYLVRDEKRQPLLQASRDRQPLAVCLHHANGVNVCYDDSSVEFLKREELGLGPDDPIETGPDAKSPLLRVFPPRRIP